MTAKNNNTDSHHTTDGFDAALDQASSVDSKYSTEISDVETKAAFQQVAGQTGIDRSPTSTGWNIWKYAAAALLLVGLTGLGYLMTPTQIIVPNGEIETITLPDQSTVTLNSGSELSYGRWFNFWGRTVSLDGEAFFEVQPSDTPFKVEAGRSLVTVTGTKFNVRSWSTSPHSETSVFLKEGQVLFASTGERSQAVTLKAGQSSQLRAQEHIPSPPQTVKNTAPTAWMDRGISFEDQPLSMVFDEISRRFDVTIQTEQKDILTEKLTIYLSNVSSAEQTLADVCRAKGLSYNKKAGIFVVSRSYN